MSMAPLSFRAHSAGCGAVSKDHVVVRVAPLSFRAHSAGCGAASKDHAGSTPISVRVEPLKLPCSFCGMWRGEQRPRVDVDQSWLTFCRPNLEWASDTEFERYWQGVHAAVREPSVILTMQ